ncbi:hypothetical protein Saa2_09234 [Streptomyces acidiscabies]|nr:hypothetical protein Saa2_09234 [Streptomyces acidiscabies]
MATRRETVTRGRCRAVCAGEGFGLTATSGSTTPARATHAGASARAWPPGACGRGLSSKGRRVCACGMCGAICASGVIDGVARAESRVPSRLFRITAYARGRLPLRCLRVARAGRPSARGSFWRAPAPCTASLLPSCARARETSFGPWTSPAPSAAYSRARAPCAAASSCWPSGFPSAFHSALRTRTRSRRAGYPSSAPARRSAAASEQACDVRPSSERRSVGPAPPEPAPSRRSSPEYCPRLSARPPRRQS